MIKSTRSRPLAVNGYCTHPMAKGSWRSIRSCHNAGWIALDQSRDNVESIELGCIGDVPSQPESRQTLATTAGREQTQTLRCVVADFRLV